MRLKHGYKLTVPPDNATQELQSSLKYNDNQSIRPDNTHILEEVKGKLLKNNDATSPKRFPKEVFKLPVSARRKMMASEVVSLAPGPFEWKQQKIIPCSDTTVVQTARVQILRATTFKELEPLPISLTTSTTPSTTKYKSNQSINLGMAFNSKLTKFPKKDLIKTMQPQIKKNMAKLKPIQRTVHTSQNGIIKILLPRNFIISETRPSTKEDKQNKITTSPSSVKSCVVNTGVSSFADNLIGINKCDARRNDKMSMRSSRKDEEEVELCDVTFGMYKFQEETTT